MSEIEKRINKVMVSTDADAIFIYNCSFVDKNFFYMSGLYNGVFERCGILCEKCGKIYIFTTPLEEEVSKRARDYIENVEIVVLKNENDRNKKFKNILSSYKRIGLNFDFIPYSFYNDLKSFLNEVELVDIGKSLRMARMIKSKDEIEKIKKACNIVSEVADSIPDILIEGITELDLAAEIEYSMKKKGANGQSFKTIVAFAENSSKPHYSGGNVKLKIGDVVLVDYGAEYLGYVSDITQTYLTGKPAQEIVHTYKTVYNAQRLAIELIKDGISAEFVEDEVRKYIDCHEKYKGRFIHSLGHSIGLEVHDGIYPSKDFDKKFSENMVLTVEPGIYLPGSYGVRLEDDVIVKKDSCEVITTAKKELATYEV